MKQPLSGGPTLVTDAESSDKSVVDAALPGAVVSRAGGGMGASPATAAGAAALDPASAASAAEEATTIAGEDEAPIARRSARFWLVSGSHSAVDLYAAIIPALSLALAASLHLDKVQLRSLFVLNSVISGICQPLFAWLTDKWNTRACAPLGLLIGAVSLCLIGYAENYLQLIGLQIVGMIGVGMFHPIGAALAGHLGRGLRLGRSMAVTVFFTAGMVGSVLGPPMVTRMNKAGGLSTLVWLIAPGMVLTMILFAASRRVPHRHSLVTARLEESPARAAVRKRALVLLFWAAVMRFGVNTGLFYLFARWAAARMPGDANQASVLNGGLFACASFGMGAAAMVAGWRVRPGHEKGPMVWLPLLGAPTIVAMAFTPAGASGGYWAMLALALVSAAGYSASAPLAISLAQRLMPGKTGMASSLMMGGAWTISAFFPFLAGWAVDEWGLRGGFVVMAAFLVVNAGLAAALPAGLLRETARH